MVLASHAVTPCSVLIITVGKAANTHTHTHTPREANNFDRLGHSLAGRVQLSCGRNAARNECVRKYDIGGLMLVL